MPRLNAPAERGLLDQASGQLLHERAPSLAPAEEHKGKEEKTPFTNRSLFLISTGFKAPLTASFPYQPRITPVVLKYSVNGNVVWATLCKSNRHILELSLSCSVTQLLKASN